MKDKLIYSEKVSSTRTEFLFVAMTVVFFRLFIWRINVDPFNFLEHSRVVKSFKRKVGWVQDISFSTSHPDEVIHLIQAAKSAQNAA
jgi:hypothetical protein